MKYIKNKNIKWWIGIISCFVLFFIIGIFAYSKTYFLVRGVEIKTSIEYKDKSSLVNVIGNAKNATHISLNGREIFIDKEGNFEEQISLLPGFQVITISVEDKFGKRNEKNIPLYFKI